MASQAYANQAQANAIASSNATTAAALTAYLPKSGGTMSGPLVVAGADLTVYRAGGTTGVIFLNSSSSAYVYWNGSSYNMPGGELVVNGYQLARLLSPGFQGVPTAPTPAAADSSTTLATTAFVHAVANIASTQAANGKMTLPGGLIFQWGSVAASPGGEVQGLVGNLPFANPNNTFFVNLIANGGTPMFVQSWTKSQFTYGTGYTGGKATTTLFVFAIGN
jgi:hypothetical protein